MFPNLQGGSLSGGISLQKSAPVQKTYSPQITAPSTTIQNTANPQTQNLQFSSPAAAVTAPNPSPAPAPAPVDPYAGTVFGSTDNFNRVHGNWQNQVTDFNNSLPDRYNTDAGTYGASINDYVDGIKSGTLDLNHQYEQNELARQQGAQGVNDLVSHGIKSMGIRLANMPGASDSSAGEAVARAYGDIGQRDMSQVGNQFALAQDQTDLNKRHFDDQTASGARHLGDQKASLVNGIVNDATTEIAQLNASAAYASLPDRIDMENRKAAIRNEAMAKLSALDGQISQGQQANQLEGSDAVREHATALRVAGTPASNPFQLTTQVPAEFQNTGPFSADLPLFTVPGARRQGQ
jgi:hypothetical protein